ncbi:MAG: ElyC/SanA/YdcF family protein, partial [Steroidobacteraceae bacterium]
LAHLFGSPLLLALMVAVASGIFRLWGRRRIAAGMLIAAGAIAYLGSIVLVGDALLGALERRYQPIRDGQSLPPASWIVVLGSDFAPRDGIPVTAALDADGLVRIVEGVRLAREYSAVRLLLSGGARAGFAAPARGYAELARGLGVAADSIEISDKALDTASEAREVVRLLGGAQFVLVTSAYHMPRAMRLMHDAGGRPIPAPTGQLTNESRRFTLRSLLPSSIGLRKTERALHEYLGFLAIDLGVTSARMKMAFAMSVLVALIVSALLTGFVRRLAMAHRVLDVPNDRSSHTTPTPRGGGIGMVLTLLAAISILGAFGVITPRWTLAMLTGGGAVAIVGFVDDKWQVPAYIRLMVHFLAVSLYVWLIGRLPPIDFGIAIWDLGLFGTVMGVFVLVWFLNLYNFMDGIDGIAGAEAVSVAIVAAALLISRGIESPEPLVLFLTAAAAGGFLLWNWPPARIFMGDAGSGFLGFSLGAIAWLTVSSGELSIWVWLILFGLFFIDATVTLLRRWGRGELPATAHRSHAYQRLSRRFGSHRKVTVGFVIVNVVWLGPLAWLATTHPSLGAPATLVAWTPFAIYSWCSGAGLPDA